MRAILLTILFTITAFGQGRLDVLPLPLVSPVAIEPGTLITPMTTEEKAKRAFQNTFGWRALMNRAAISGIDQINDNPEEWQRGWEGYGMRYGSRLGRLAGRNFIMLGTDVAFGLDPRYDRCDCLGFKSRTGHAVRRVFVARRDAGGEWLNVSQLAGGYLTPALTNQWNPDRLNTTGTIFRNGSTYLAWQAGSNMLKEFWPEIRRKIPFKRPKR